MMKLANVILLSVLGVAATMAAAQVYKWKDIEGKIHYSDMPPLPGQVKSEVVKTGDTPVSSIATPKAPPIVTKSAEPSSAPAAQVQKDPKICQQAKARKSFLESGQLSQSVNDKGEVEFLSDEKRQNEIAEADKAIKTFCP